MLIGIDYGTKRTGIAVSDDAETMAFPYGVWETKKDITQEIISFARERGASAVIIGESRDFSGNLNPIAKDIERLVHTLKTELSVPVYYEPEFLTSQEAARIQGEGAATDASAAALILQSFMEKQKNK
ncbi:MAG: RuvX/YqgF family protein, partial [Patescibacteria group bacterium]